MIFISYSLKDEAPFTSLCLALEAANVPYWKGQLRAGASLKDQLRDAISKCDICIFIATRSSVTSQWCLNEIGAFWGAGKRIIIFSANPDIENKLPPLFKGDYWTCDARAVISQVKEELEEIELKEQPSQPSPTPEEPNFTINLGQAITYYDRRNDMTVFLVHVQVSNSGAPSSVIGWKTHYKSSTLDSEVLILKFVEEPLRIPLPSESRRPNEAEAALEFYRADSIDEKTAASAVTRGVPISGRLPLWIPGRRGDEIHSGDATITVTAYDYLERPYSAQYMADGRGGRLERVLPGERLSPVKKKKDKS